MLRAFLTAAGLFAALHAAASDATVEALRYEIVAEYPHDPEAFIQGLVFLDGVLYESTGLYGKSSLREVDLATGNVLRSKDLRISHFGEGLALAGDRLYQLTWLSHTGFIYDLESFEKLGEFAYRGEGWGLAWDGESLVMSDGSATLRFLSPESFDVLRRVEVREGGEPVVDLNELECHDGAVWANVWYTDAVVRIDPSSGRVTGRLDLSDLWPERPKNEDAVLNGIAVNPENGHFFVTGKLWGKLFEIRLLAQPD